MLREWIARPHVSEWWSGEIELDPELEQVLAVSGDIDVGYLQIYRAIDGHAAGWWLQIDDPGVFGIDLFVADPARLSSGIGAAMVKAALELLFARPLVTRVQADPSPDNARAIRCYEKAGFRRAGEIVTPDGAAALLLIDRQSWRR